MTPLSALIARLEAAKEGSRELDALIFALVFDAELRPWSGTKRARKLWWFKRNSEQVLHYGENNHPQFTTSLDAALTLKQTPGYTIIEFENGTGFQVEVDDETADAKTAPLGVCICILKAREAGR